jgi:hypothetical protein
MLRVSPVSSAPALNPPKETSHAGLWRAVVSPLCPVRTADGVECGGDTDAWAKPEAPPAAVTVHCKTRAARKSSSRRRRCCRDARPSPASRLVSMNRPVGLAGMMTYVNCDIPR